MNGPALAAAIGGPAVGIAGLVFGWLNSKSERDARLRDSSLQREHERDLARDDRLHDELRAAYGELLGFFTLLGEIVARTKPLIGPAPEPPASPSAEERLRIYARASVIGSDEVMDAAAEALLRYRSFQGAVLVVEEVERQGGADPELWKNIQESREKFVEQVEALERLIRQETRR